MADKKKKDMPVQETTNSKYNKRRWFSPKKRSEGYANDLREKVHTYGKKEGKELTDKEACIFLLLFQKLCKIRIKSNISALILILSRLSLRHNPASFR